MYTENQHPNISKLVFDYTLKYQRSNTRHIHRHSSFDCFVVDRANRYYLSCNYLKVTKILTTFALIIHKVASDQHCNVTTKTLVAWSRGGIEKWQYWKMAVLENGGSLLKNNGTKNGGTVKWQYWKMVVLENDSTWQWRYWKMTVLKNNSTGKWRYSKVAILENYSTEKWWFLVLN